MLSTEFNLNQNTLLILEEITAGSTLMLHVHLQRKPLTNFTQTSTCLLHGGLMMALCSGLHHT